MFSTSVDSIKWFFMKQADKVMFFCNLLHNFHCQLIVVNRYVCGIKYRCQLMLCRRYFVMFGFR